MPKTNRNKDIDYTIILINNEADKVKLLDITTNNNYRNYQWAVNDAIKKDTKKTNKIINEIRKYGTDKFTYEKLEYFTGKYTDAIKKLNEISNTLGIMSNYSVSAEVIELREKLIKKNEIEIEKTDEEQIKDVLTDIIDEVVNTNEEVEQPNKVKCDNKVKCETCDKMMLKSNLKRHIKSRHSN
jgi:hypothetical protein